MNEHKLKEIHEKKLESIKSKNFMRLLSASYHFTEKQLKSMLSNFKKMSSNSIMNEKLFCKSLGILGMDGENYLAKRIFTIMDEDNDGRVYFQDYIKFLSTLLSGSEEEKAKQSFKILDCKNKNKITYEELEIMVIEISRLWNFLTGAKIDVSKEYLDKLYYSLDADGDGFIDLDEYIKLYKTEEKIFGWFEFLNQDEFIFHPAAVRQFSSKFEETSEIFGEGEKNISELMKSNIDVDNKISFLEGEIKNCLSMLEKIDSENQQNKIFVNNYSFSDQKNIAGDKRNMNQHSFSNSILEKNSFDSSINKSSMLHELEESSEPIFGNLCFNDADCNSIKKDEIVPNFGNMSEILVNNEDQHTYEAIKKKLTHMLEVTIEAKDCLQQHSKEINKSISRLSLQKSGSSSLIRSPEKCGSFVLKSELFKLQSSESIQRRSESPPKNVISPFKNKSSFTNNNATKRFSMKQHLKKHENDETSIKMNLSVYFGHANWNLILNLQVGMRTAIKNLLPDVSIQEKDFNTVCSYQLLNVHHTNFNKKTACKFYDYAPTVFQKIRYRYGVNNIEYLKSVGPEGLLGNLILGNMHSLTELLSTGKSGSFFYFTQDIKYMLKTISRSEFNLFRKIIKPYYHHFMANKDTLITRIFNLQKIEIYFSKSNRKKIYFVVMTNLFSTGISVDAKYDLKGSTYQRRTRKPGKFIDKGTALKDLDFQDDDNYIRIDEQSKLKFIETINSDSQFLERLGIIDYSLLVGIHTITNEEKLSFNQPLVNSPFTTFAESFYGGVLSRDNKSIYVIGIIDCFTKYNTKKKFEHNFKKITQGKGISCVPPKPYGIRFRNFMQTIFKQIK